MKKLIKRIFKAIGILLLIHIVGIVGWRLLYGRDVVDSPLDLDKLSEMTTTWAASSPTRKSPSTMRPALIRQSTCCSPQAAGAISSRRWTTTATGPA